jgi:hypothetical protein
LDYDIYVSDESHVGFTSDYNLLYKSGLGKIGYWQTDYTSFFDWTFEVNLDQHSQSADPGFVNLSGADGILGRRIDGTDGGRDDDFHLRADSPAIDAGNPLSLFSVEPAPNGGRIDQGAYGNTVQATPSAPVAGIVTQSNGFTEVVPGGSADAYTVVLTAPPTDDVTVTIHAGDPLVTSPSVLIFTPANWNIARSIAVDAAGITELPGDFVITHTFSSVDNRYNNASLADVTVHLKSPTNTNSEASLKVAANSTTQAEGNSGTTLFTFTVARSGDTSSVSTATYLVTGSGSHPANAADFGGTFPTGTVSFAMGVASRTITISVSADTTIETDEDFTVTLSNPSAGTTIATSFAVSTIVNDDSAPPLSSLSISTSSSNKSEGDSGSTSFTFTVTRTGATTNAASANYAVAGSLTNAANETDFGGSFPTGSVTFAAGVTSRTITINVSGDATVESDEGFIVTLSNVTGATLLTSTATGTILNDDEIVSPGIPTIHLAGTPLSYQAKSTDASIDSNALFEITGAEVINLSHAALTVNAGLRNSDRKQNKLGIRSSGSGTGQIQIVSNIVRFEGQGIGQFAITKGVLTIRFEEAATTDAVKALVQALTFSTKTRKPAARTVSVAFSMNGTFSDVVSTSRTILITR